MTSIPKQTGGVLLRPLSRAAPGHQHRLGRAASTPGRTCCSGQGAAARRAALSRGSSGWGSRRCATSLTVALRARRYAGSRAVADQERLGRRGERFGAPRADPRRARRPAVRVPARRRMGGSERWNSVEGDRLLLGARRRATSRSSWDPARLGRPRLARAPRVALGDRGRRALAQRHVHRAASGCAVSERCATAT